MNSRLLLCFISLVFISCAGDRKEKKAPDKQVTNTWYVNKPPSAFPDTIKINSEAAVFYYPDSLQLQKIRSVTDPGVFESKMHEYEYLLKTAHSVIHKNYPHLQILEAKNIRYLLFITSDKKESCIDLDKNFEPYGLYVFDRQMAPQAVDMSNTETDLGFYFSK